MRKLVTYTFAAALLLAACGESWAKGGIGGGGGRSFSSGAGRSYSGGGRSYSSGVRSAAPSASSGKTFSSGNATAPTAGRTYGSGSKPTYSAAKPPSVKFDSMAARDQLKVESRKSFVRGEAAKPTFKTPAGKEVNLRSTDASRIRSTITEEKWVHRETRMQTVYTNYVTLPQPTYVYNDHFNVFFWMWLMDRSSDQRAMWAYHHRADMDAQRYKELLAKDAQLEAKIKALEAQKVAANSGYTPAGIEEDLMYTHDYVDAAINPQPKPVATTGWRVTGWICCGLLISVLVGLLAYFVFFYRGF